MPTGFFARLFGHGHEREPKPMTCHEAAEVLQQYLDGEIDHAQAARVTAHLEVCRVCGLEADTYERIKSTIATRRNEVPADAVDRLRTFGASLREAAPGG